MSLLGGVPIRANESSQKESTQRLAQDPTRTAVVNRMTPAQILMLSFTLRPFDSIIAARGKLRKNISRGGSTFILRVVGMAADFACLAGQLPGVSRRGRLGFEAPSALH